MSCGTMLALALTAGGTAAQEVAASDEKSKMNTDVQNELNQQKNFQQQATNVFQDSAQKSSLPAFGANQQAGQQQALQSYQQLQAAPLQMGQQQLPSYGIVNEGNQAAIRGQSNAASAPLFGYDNALAQMGNKDTLANANLGLISNQAQNALSTLPYMLQQDSQSSAGLAGIGSLLSTGGGLLGLYNATLPGAKVGTPPVRWDPNFSSAWVTPGLQ